MRPLSTVERFLERALERPAARLLRARLRPVQVLRRVERAMESERSTVDGRLLVPEQVTVAVHPRDLAALGKPEDLADYLAEGALAFARAHGYRVARRPTVRLHADAQADRGEPVVVASFAREAASAPEGGTAGSANPATGWAPAHVDQEVATGNAPRPVDASALDADDPVTRAFEAPVVRAPSAFLEIRPPRGAPRRIELGSTPVTIGRAVDNALVLDDPRVSRHHARIQARGGSLVLTDLGSTNGTLVNGSRIREVVLGADDAIVIGDTALSIVSPLGDPSGRHGGR